MHPTQNLVGTFCFVFTKERWDEKRFHGVSDYDSSRLKKETPKEMTIETILVVFATLDLRL